MASSSILPAAPVILVIKHFINIFISFNILKLSASFFIIKGFWTIVFIFIVISIVLANMSFGLLQVFVELGNLHGTSNYILYWNHKGRLYISHTGYKF